MVRCPRCGNAADQLHPLPVETLANGPTAGPGEAAGADGKVCRWCLHEVNEG